MKQLILAALTATTLAAPAQANNDIGLLILGFIAGAAVTDREPAPTVQQEHHHWQHPRPERRERHTDWNTVCGYQTEYTRNWIITTGINCAGAVVTETRRRR